MIQIKSVNNDSIRIGENLQPIHLVSRTTKGESAYELASQNGFQGTLEEWLESLVDADLTDLAGAGRTTETVKGNADALGAALGAALSTLTTTAKTLVGAINEVDGDADVLKVRPWTENTDANTLGTGIYEIVQGGTPGTFHYPFGYGVLVSFITPSYVFQIFARSNLPQFHIRTGMSSSSWGSWLKLAFG